MPTVQSPYYEQVIEELDEFLLEHLPALLEMMRLFRKSLVLTSSTESFRQAWQEAMNGETLPLAEMWTGIDVDSTRNTSHNRIQAQSSSFSEIVSAH